VSKKGREKSGCHKDNRFCGGTYDPLYETFFYSTIKISINIGDSILKKAF